MFEGGKSLKFVATKHRVPLAVGALMVIGLVLAGCGSNSASPSTTSTSTSLAKASHSATTTPPASTPPTTAVATGSTTSTCPSVAQASAAVGQPYTTLVHNPSQGGSIICIYNGAGAVNAEVVIFAHGSAAVFAGQVANAPGKPAMPAISGVGDGAYGQTIAGRSIVNAYSSASRTLVAAQSAGPLPPVEALARVALSVN
ncbi:MAG: hypothetical protein WBG41_15865 [Acidimicrobiales bacterium]